MKGYCVFVFFMIFNAILGVVGIGILLAGILFIATINLVDSGSTNPGTQVASNLVFIALIIIGLYITTIFILGACSKNRRGVLIAYFVLILILVFTDIGMAVYFSNLRYLNLANVTTFTACVAVFGVSAGFGGLNFVLALIYFILIGSEENPPLYTNVSNIQYVAMTPQYQNV